MSLASYSLFNLIGNRYNILENNVLKYILIINGIKLSNEFHFVMVVMSA